VRGGSGMAKQRILVVEDHTILREALRALLSSNADFDIVDEAEDGLEAVRRARSLAPDIVLIDLSMPKVNGMEAIREIRRRGFPGKVLALTIHKTEDFILEALEAGADGYILKDETSYAELMRAIETVVSGKPYLSPGASEKVINRHLRGRKHITLRSSWDTLTQRERGVLKLIGEGYINREIADALCISAKTVEKHRANLMKKLNLRGTSALTAFAIEKGLVVKRRVKPAIHA
jgi:DNA-binding NarL/FixJ family response regulator